RRNIEQILEWGKGNRAARKISACAFSCSGTSRSPYFSSRPGRRAENRSRGSCARALAQNGSLLARGPRGRRNGGTPFVPGASAGR
ncbi:unnamed protein product, partial [Mycena citricolor]